MARLVTFGEAMVRLTPPGYGSLEHASSLDVYVGGSELNVAVLAARLGVQSRWVSHLPDNQLGQTIPCKKCQESFVATAIDDEAPTVLAELVDESPRPSAYGVSPPTQKPTSPQ